MPTSKSRKGRITARLKQKQRIALERKSKLGLAKSHCTIQKANSKRPGVLSKIIGYLHFMLKDDVTPESTPEKEKEDCKNSCASNDFTTSNRKLSDINAQKNTLRKADESEYSHLLQNDDNISTCLTVNESEAPASNQRTSLSWHGYPFSIIKVLPMKIWKALNSLLTPLASSNELIDLKRRVMLLEQSVEKLRGMLDIQNAERNLSIGNSMNEVRNTGTIPISIQVMQQRPPPPPPPPPPPLPSFPSTNVQTVNISNPKKKDKKRKVSFVGAFDKEDSSNGLLITNDLLSKVKLRRVTDKNDIKKEARVQGRHLVTVKDLHSVKLRKTSHKENYNEMQNDDRTPLKDVLNMKKFSINKENQIKSAIFSTPQCVYNLRKSLKKVDLARSPGGTPLVKVRRETGVGLTPLLSAALKRKFEV